MDNKTLIHSFFYNFLEKENVKFNIFNNYKLNKLIDDANSALYFLVDSILFQYENKEDPTLLTCIVQLMDSKKFHFSYRFTVNVPNSIAQQYIGHKDTLFYKLNVQKTSVFCCADIIEFAESDSILYEQWSNLEKPNFILCNPLLYKNEIFGYTIDISSGIDLFSDKYIEQSKIIAGLINAAFIDTFNYLLQKIKLMEKDLLLEIEKLQKTSLLERNNLISKNAKEAILLLNNTKTISYNNSLREKLEHIMCLSENNV
jgi:hypothetical protein